MTSRPMDGDGLVIAQLTKRFAGDGPSLAAVDGIDLTIEPGEFFTMLGPSGCGKTTTLRMIAGLEVPSEGSIRFRGRDLAAVPARERNIGMVFQSYALFPHLTVFENVAYGLRRRATPADELRRAVGEVLDLLQLAPLAGRLPAKLSGGQQQRVSIARALVYRPDILLLDEPLANLDAKLRVQMREEIRALQRRLGIMAVYVTHDQEEAMAVSDRLAVFESGRLVQVGAPLEVYARPRTLFVADFIGKANFLPAQPIGRGATGMIVALPSGERLEVTRLCTVPPAERERMADHEGLLMVRPEHLTLDAGRGAMTGEVRRVQFLGGIVRYAVTLADQAGEVVAETARPVAGIGEGSACRLGFTADDALLFLRGPAA